MTNTVVAVDASKNTRGARPLLSYVPPGATVYMDADYDVEYNYEYGQERRITLIVYPKLYDEEPYGGYHRHQAQKNFSKKKYGRRKLVERPIREQRGLGRRHTELPKARHAEKRATAQVRSP